MRQIDRLSRILKVFRAALVDHRKMVLSRDFGKLLVVCLKMLFRRSTRNRFICLVILFLIMMGLNTCNYVRKFHQAESQKRVILNERAFKVFFLRSRTKNDCARFLARHTDRLKDYGSKIVNEAFIYQNNLYVHFFPPFEDLPDHPGDRDAINLLYDLFNIRDASRDFYLNDGDGRYGTKVRNYYIDHNGAWLNDSIVAARHSGLQYDLTDIADMIREEIRGRRIDVFNSVKRTILKNIQRQPLDGTAGPNLYLSRVESIIPMNLLHIFMNIRNDNTTDIVDLEESVRPGEGATIETDRSFLTTPPIYVNQVMYGDMDIYPRYIPLYIPDLLSSGWNWLLYQDIDIRNTFLDYIDQLHFNGHYMFSYEKSHIIKDQVKKINDDISSNHVQFYLTDLSMGIAFPFMISLFAFIHLKTEIAFLFMFKNRIKALLFIFWMLPVSLMLLVKGGILMLYLIYLLKTGFGLTAYITLPLFISLLAASAVFYPINRWCFSQFTGDSLDLYALHKGR